MTENAEKIVRMDRHSHHDMPSYAEHKNRIQTRLR